MVAYQFRGILKRIRDAALLRYTTVLMLTISGTNRNPHDLAASIFGGGVHRYDPPNLRHKPYYQWVISGPSAVVLLEKISDYLLIKKEQALVGIRFQELMKRQIASRRGLPVPHRITPKDILEREELFQEMTLLNNPTNRRVNLVGDSIEQRKCA